MKVETATIIIILLILLIGIGFTIFRQLRKYVLNSMDEEGFRTQSNKVVVIDDPQAMYDSYYVERIDGAYHPQNKNICRCSELYKHAFHGILPKNKTNVLLIGTTTGRFLDALCGMSNNVSAVSNHEILHKTAKKNAPSANVILGDAVRDSELFPKRTFTHIIFEDREFYRLSKEERKLVLNNCKSWLRPEGTLVIRAVDPEVFDPMIPTSVPLSGINIQKYLTERKTDSQVRFTDGSKIATHYTPIPSEHRALFREDIYDPNGVKLRTHIHRWYMPPRDVIMEEVLSLGYYHKDTIQLQGCTFPGEYYEVFLNGVPKMS